MTVEKRLVRPRNDRWIAGVCGGVARYFGLDSTLVRVVWALFVCLAGTGVLAYLICWIVIPNEP
jgi:phage shock protein C